MEIRCLAPTTASNAVQERATFVFRIRTSAVSPTCKPASAVANSRLLPLLLHCLLGVAYRLPLVGSLKEERRWQGKEYGNAEDYFPCAHCWPVGPAAFISSACHMCHRPTSKYGQPGHQVLVPYLSLCWAEGIQQITQQHTDSATRFCRAWPGSLW